MRFSIVVAMVMLASCKQGTGEKYKLNEKLVCDSNATGELTRATLTLTPQQAQEWGEAFSAGGNCDAKLIDVDITSPTVAIRAGGNTKLVLEGGRIEAGTIALDLSGNAQVEVKGAQIIGEVKTSGNAKVTGMETAKPATAAPAGEGKGGEAKAGEGKAGEAKAGEEKAGEEKAGEAKAGEAKGEKKSGEGGW